MVSKKINNSIQPYNVLVAPLDWGLGHATRCIPIIRSLVHQGFKVFVATEGKGKILLEKEFPELIFLELKGYRIVYSNNARNFQSKLFMQIPKILNSIRLEKKWLKNAIQKYRLHAVISDNRYGLQSPAIFSVFLTHQLHIETGNKVLNRVAQKVNYKYINKFDSCWIPDFEESPSLAGILSHPQKKPNTTVTYVNPLSRLYPFQAPKKTDLVIMLSGPEPQRTILEKLLLEKVLIKIEKQTIFIRGLPGVMNELQESKNIKFFNHVPALALQEILGNATQVLCRCGYSTIMDLVSLKATAILIPTPGQSEQEYLADHLNKTGLFTCVPQNEESILNALKQETLKPVFPEIDYAVLDKVINNLKNLINDK